jgi:hypothetical protein
LPSECQRVADVYVVVDTVAISTNSLHHLAFVSARRTLLKVLQRARRGPLVLRQAIRPGDGNSSSVRRLRLVPSFAVVWVL